MIGAGLFNNISPTAKVSSYATILGLVIAATVATANASSSAQLAALYPQTGGTYLYASSVGKHMQILREWFYYWKNY